MLLICIKLPSVNKIFVLSIFESCGDPGIFVRGCPAQSDKKSSENGFFFFVCFFFFCPQLILLKSNG